MFLTGSGSADSIVADADGKRQAMRLWHGTLLVIWLVPPPVPRPKDLILSAWKRRRNEAEESERVAFVAERHVPPPASLIPPDICVKLDEWCLE